MDKVGSWNIKIYPTPPQGRKGSQFESVTSPQFYKQGIKGVIKNGPIQFIHKIKFHNR